MADQVGVFSYVRAVVMGLHPEQQSENYKYFEAGGYENAESHEVVRTDGYYMTNAQFEAMGCPERITVAVTNLQPPPPKE